MDSAVNLLADLDDERFGQPYVHRALEALDARGIQPLREHRTPESFLAWIDENFAGVWSSEAAAGGAWIAYRAGSPLGFAAFDVRGLAFHWLRAWSTKPAVGIFGPLGVALGERGSGLGATLLGAALFSLRERGYRQALIPCVAAEHAGFYERHAGARVVERVDLRCGGRRWRTTVLASGNGSNFQSVLDAAAAGTLPLGLDALVVNNAGAYVVQRAQTAGVATSVVAWRRGSETRADYDGRVLAAVAATEPELVLLLGWMHVLPATFVARFPQMLNVHPAFLPLDPASDRVSMPDFTTTAVYRGGHAVEEALAAGERWVGASVHRVQTAVDRGPVLARAPLRVLPGEPGEIFFERLHALEHKVLQVAIRRWSWEQP